VIEYLLKSQWFVRCQEMGDRAAKVRPQFEEGLGLGVEKLLRIEMKKWEWETFCYKDFVAVVQRGLSCARQASQRRLACTLLRPRIFFWEACEVFSEL
jgi:valyl-tRNA synthetase